MFLRFYPTYIDVQAKTGNSTSPLFQFWTSSLLLIFVVLGTILNDTFAYFVGMAKQNTPIVNDFRACLKYLNYSFTLTEVTKVEAPKVDLPPKTVAKIEKKAVKEASSALSDPNAPKDTSYLGSAAPKKEETHGGCPPR